ncbi:uncharacterized protein LOC133173887 [Saccostrea echinata]|uniref:uncharacterized protein LOC133173887 n=1 Tax=Saccostrea echinata TaxID=191078 RepID=UPI002A827270|nr:uncharacterized protein LOC133173887 [Saccostrea echinata]
MAVFTNEVVGKLVNLWEEEESLWNVSSEACHKKESRNISLSRIKENLKKDMKMDFTVTQINCKLQSLRCYYANELKKMRSSKKSGSGISDLYTSKWPFFATLDSFLREQITPRQSMSTLDISNTSQNNDEDDEKNDDKELETPTKRKKKRNLPEEVMERAVSALSSIQERKTDVEDEDSVFAKLIANELRKIKDLRKKSLLKIKIQQLIFDTQFSNVTSSNLASLNSFNSSSDTNTMNPLTQMTSLMATEFDE